MIWRPLSDRRNRMILIACSHKWSKVAMVRWWSRCMAKNSTSLALKLPRCHLLSMKSLMRLTIARLALAPFPTFATKKINQNDPIWCNNLETIALWPLQRSHLLSSSKPRTNSRSPRTTSGDSKGHLAGKIWTRKVLIALEIAPDCHRTERMRLRLICRITIRLNRWTH